MPKTPALKKVAVLGVGRVGKAIALDLATSCDVCAIDGNAEALATFTGTGVRTLIGDLAREETLKGLVGHCDLVVNALPGHIGFSVLRNVIQCGKSVVDISFFPEDPLDLDCLARHKGVCAVVDCGVAPGFSNMVLGYHSKQMKVTNFVCYVGGLPRARVWPHQYKAPFSPADVIEEYVRPARLVENGTIVTKPALSDLEHLEFPGIGTLEAFNTDGLRTLLKTVKAANMREKTLRYPGNSEYIKVLRETGFFDTTPIEIKGVQISPRELTSRILFPHWKLDKDEEEFTVMRISVEGEQNGKPIVYTYNLQDSYDKQTKLTSMARTTGYTCAAVARLCLDGKFKSKGIVPPEVIAMNRHHFAAVLSYLKRKGISIEVCTA